jgi:4a-hydroxytetrahydrobiopterin dehydratase
MNVPDGWTIEEGGKALVRTYKFTDFSEAFGYSARVVAGQSEIDPIPYVRELGMMVDLLGV